VAAFFGSSSGALFVVTEELVEVSGVLGLEAVGDEVLSVTLVEDDEGMVEELLGAVDSVEFSARAKESC